MSMTKEQFMDDVYQKLSEAEKQVSEGKVKDAEESLENLKNKYF